MMMMTGLYNDTVCNIANVDGPLMWQGVEMMILTSRTTPLPLLGFPFMYILLSVGI